jgi:hypothetical protein
VTSQPTIEQIRSLPTLPVNQAAAFLGISERSLRRSIQPGAELAYLAIRIGRRVLVRTSALLDLVAPAPYQAAQGRRSAEDSSPRVSVINGGAS